MYRYVIRNEDVAPIHALNSEDKDFTEARQWLLQHTAEQRAAIGTDANDADWLETLFSNGFFSIARYDA